jgi:transposase
VRGTKVSVGDRFRARIILLRLEGRSETEVARTLGCSMGAVCKWSKRFDAQGMIGLKDAPGRGRKERLPTEKISLVVERATRPPQGRARWSIRSMAREAGVSKSTVQRIWNHNDIRHGTITLFAALSYLEGKIISRTEQSHTHLEWLRFLKQIDRETPKELDLHLIVDNYATHKHPVVQHWLSRHPRFHTHFTPTSSSWLNLVERFFGELTSEVVREGSFQSLRQLVRTIGSYLVERNRNPKKYVWRASGLKILDKIKRAIKGHDTSAINQ